jgi:hypothetical protein
MALVVLLAGCQCTPEFVPVPERGADAGPGQDAGPGVDGGLADAGPLLRCTAPADCGPAPTPVRVCSSFGSPAGAWSCIAGLCVLECAAVGGDTCGLEEENLECLRCPPTAPCIPSSCGGGHDLTFHVEELVCQGAGPLVVGDTVRENASNDGGCGIQFTLVRDGGEVPLGLMYLQSGRMLTMRSEPLGGGCLVYEALTGAIRLVVDCPRCQVVLGP